MEKEWNGNSRAACYCYAVKKKNSDSVREQDDFYATDPKALQMLLKAAPDIFYIYREMGWKIWEPACGNGNLSKCLQENGFVVLSTDLKDRGYGKCGVDFLKANTQCKMIITNPPYKLATEFIEHAMEILPKDGYYIALMNLNCLAGISRYKRIFSNGTLKEVYIFCKRIGCWKNGERNDSKAHIVNYAWFVFKKGYNDIPEIKWLFEN